jgi:heat shock protein HslJ
MVEVLDDTEITALFAEDNSLTGSGGCNNYATTYRVDGSELTISPAASTQMACAEPIMEQETGYFAALSNVTQFEIRGIELVLRDSAGDPVVTYLEIPPASIEGTAWNVVSYNNGRGAVVTVLQGSAITAFFGEEGSLTGSAGCNDYQSTYAVDSNNIEIGPTAVTMMACSEPEGIMEQESEYLAALETAETYAIRGAQMEMRTGSGSLAATFAASAIENTAGE